MGTMTPEKLKKKLDVAMWSQIQTQDQFYVMIKNFHKLSARTKNQMIDDVENLGAQTELFLKSCMDSIIEYEPSLISEMIDRAFAMKAYAGNDLDKKKKQTVVNVFSAFSKWFDEKGTVKCTLKGQTTMCSISEAVIMAHNHEAKKEKGNLDMYFLSEKRSLLMRAEEDQESLEQELRELIMELVEDDGEIFEMDNNRYLN